MAELLQVNDDVMWRGCFGNADPIKAKVIGIEKTQTQRSKDGEPVESMDWERVRDNYAVLILDNGHWCYGSQISPLLS